MEGAAAEGNGAGRSKGAAARERKGAGVDSGGARIGVGAAQNERAGAVLDEQAAGARDNSAVGERRAGVGFEGRAGREYRGAAIRIDRQVRVCAQGAAGKIKMNGIDRSGHRAQGGIGGDGDGSDIGDEAAGVRATAG